ncbi:MAG TPA: flagellum-specific ATP synthase FliI, partial [Spirochaeta sp.]|nr:flagellum-specific ATP synthase FliI [Spirochaeta sp.]
GLLIESSGPQVVLGEVCQILIPGAPEPVKAEVVGFRDNIVQLMPYGEIDGIEPGCVVVASGKTLEVPVSKKMLGRVIDSLGQPYDELGSYGADAWYSVSAPSPDALKREVISERITTGVRAIDFLATAGKGQRMGIFSGSGVGKSTLLGMIARNSNADVNVIALIGERGREVREFIERDLGPEGMKKSVILVSTSDTPPLARLRGAYVATAVAEYFRDQGKDVMLLFDSITRFARAQREIGLAAGEPPANRGFPPSVFEKLPKLLERCGTNDKGTITGFYTILVEGDDMDEPISDNVRGILDGHIVLERRLAQRYHYPSINVLNSLSRLATVVTDKDEQQAAGKFRRLLSAYTEAEDLINVGAYAAGSNTEIDEAISRIDSMNDFLRQEVDDPAPLKKTLSEASAIVEMPIIAAAEEKSGVEAE